MERTFDKIVSVRVAAVNALERLQTADEEDEFVVQGLCRVLKSDPSKYDLSGFIFSPVGKYEGLYWGRSFCLPVL